MLRSSLPKKIAVKDKYTNAGFLHTPLNAETKPKEFLVSKAESLEKSKKMKTLAENKNPCTTLPQFHAL